MNGQSKGDTGNIGHTRLRKKTNKTQKHHTEDEHNGPHDKPLVNIGAREWLAVLTFHKAPAMLLMWSRRVGHR